MTQTLNAFNQSPEKGQLDLQLNVNVITCQVADGQSTALVPGQCVKIEDTATDGTPIVVAVAADTDEVFGVVATNTRQSSFAAGNDVEIALDTSVIYMESDAAIAAGARVMPVVTDEQVATATNEKTVIGRALDKAGGAGELIRVYVMIELIAIPA